jgi:ADP-dependent NAD(P)H-hydrate dehydratase / NAD(P)H-hydrate epimerase
MPLPIVSVRQMREWEQAAWAAGKTSSEVIARVGRVVAERALALTSAGHLILILAGKGHNGDDARAAVPRLTAREVILLEVTNPKTVIDALRTTLRERRVGLIIDGFFGIGLSRDLDDSWKKIISLVNDSSIPVLAIDVPSGLDADSGKMCGTAMRATVTLTIGAAKKGLLEPLAIPFVGRLEVAAEL